MKVAFCAQCGNRLPQSASFCPFCGTKVDRSVESTEQVTESENINLDSTFECAGTNNQESHSNTISSSQDTIENGKILNAADDNGSQTINAGEHIEHEFEIECKEDTDASSQPSECITTPVDKEYKHAEEISEAIYKELMSTEEQISGNEADRDINIATEVATQPLEENTKQTKGKDYSWIPAIIVVAIATGIAGFNAWLKKENERMGKEIIEMMGGPDKVHDYLQNNASQKTNKPEAPKTYHNDRVELTIPSDWFVTADEVYELGCEITINDRDINPQKSVIVTLMKKQPQFTTRQMLVSATSKLETDPLFAPAKLGEIKETTFQYKKAYVREGYFQKHDDWQQNVKYAAYEDGNYMVCVFLSNMFNNNFSSDDFNTICKNIKILK